MYICTELLLLGVPCVGATKHEQSFISMFSWYLSPDKLLIPYLADFKCLWANSTMKSRKTTMVTEVKHDIFMREFDVTETKLGL